MKEVGPRLSHSAMCFDGLPGKVKNAILTVGRAGKDGKL